MGTIVPFPAKAAPPTPPPAAPFAARFPVDVRDLDAPHRRLLVPVADLLAVALEQSHAATDTRTADRLDQAWLLVVAAIADTGGGNDDGPPRRPRTKRANPAARSVRERVGRALIAAIWAAAPYIVGFDIALKALRP